MVVKGHIQPKSGDNAENANPKGLHGVDGNLQTTRVLSDLASTLAKAKQQNKAVYLLFTGSDWCPPCISLDRQVLQSSRWQKLTQTSVLTFTCDSSIKKQLSQRTQQEINCLANSFNVTNYPTQIILDPSGKELDRRMGYQPGPIGPYLGWVQSFAQLAQNPEAQ